jgi:hypothetical protein
MGGREEEPLFDGTQTLPPYSVFLLFILLTDVLHLLAIDRTSSLLAPRLCLTIKRADVLP